MHEVTAETILAAHITERSASTSYPWSDDTLARADHETDVPYGAAGEVMLRVTYESADAMLPDPQADYCMMQAEGQNPDSVIRDAQDISLHDGIFGVAIYHVGSESPLAIYADGEPYLIGGGFE